MWIEHMTNGTTVHRSTNWAIIGDDKIFIQYFIKIFCSFLYNLSTQVVLLWRLLRLRLVDLDDLVDLVYLYATGGYYAAIYIYTYLYVRVSVGVGVGVGVGKAAAATTAGWAINIGMFCFVCCLTVEKKWARH